MPRLAGDTLDLRRRVRAGRVREHAARDDDGHRHPPLGVHARPADGRAGGARGDGRERTHALPHGLGVALVARRHGLGRRDVRRAARARADPRRDGGPAGDRRPAALAASLPARAARRRRGAVVRRGRRSSAARASSRGCARTSSPTSRTSCARRSRRCGSTSRRCGSAASRRRRSAPGRSTTSSARRRGSAISSSACSASRAASAPRPIRASRRTSPRSCDASSPSSSRWPTHAARSSWPRSTRCRVWRCSRDALRHIVLNLLDNAVKYGPRGQTVRVRLGSARGAGRGAARLEIDDEGPGIPVGERERVWRPYQRGGAGADGGERDRPRPSCATSWRSTAAARGWRTRRRGAARGSSSRCPRSRRSRAERIVRRRARRPSRRARTGSVMR